jgi:hypothetical protein
MKMPLSVRLIITLLVIQVLLPGDSQSAPRCDPECDSNQECRPYGGYCRNKRQGWYGGRHEVKGFAEANSLLQEYFAGSRAKVGELRERETYFEAEVINPRGVVVDRVIVDKRTGRIRSIF